MKRISNYSRSRSLPWLVIIVCDWFFVVVVVVVVVVLFCFVFCFFFCFFAI